MRTRVYEALVILKMAGNEQEMAKSATELEESVKKAGGQIESSQGWGRRKLAFRILRHAEGYYHLLRFSATTDRVDDIKRLYRLNEVIVRFLILSQDEVESPQPARSA